MSVDLARRLVHAQLISADVLEVALAEWARGDKPLVRALVEHSPDVVPLLNTTLGQIDGPSIKRVQPIVDIVDRLPRGMCPALMALPIREDARTGTVDVAVVDLADSHVTREFEHHLRAPVRLVRAQVADLLAALRGLRGRARDPEHAPERTPVFGTPVARPASRQGTPSLRPRAISEPPQTQDYARGAPRGRQRRLTPAGGEVIDLTRAKPNPNPQEGSHLIVDEAALERTQELLFHAENADDIARLLSEGLRHLAAQVLVFAARGDCYEGRVGVGVDSERVLAIKISANVPNILLTAAQSGYYLGPLPATSVHASLREVLTQSSEVGVASVQVRNRPILLAVLGGIGDAMNVTRRADGLARLAGQALERILVQRRDSD